MPEKDKAAPKRTEPQREAHPAPPRRPGDEPKHVPPPAETTNADDEERKERARIRAEETRDRDEPGPWDRAKYVISGQGLYDHDPANDERLRGYRPNPDVDLSNPKTRAAFGQERAEYAAEINRLAAEKPDKPDNQPTPPRNRDAPPVRVVQPETIDQQTMQMSDVPVTPGNLRKVEVLSTDPSQVQVMRPAGEVAVSNAQPTMLDTLKGMTAEELDKLHELVESVRGRPERMGNPAVVRYLEQRQGRPGVPPNVKKIYRHDGKTNNVIYMRPMRDGEPIPVGEDPELDKKFQNKTIEFKSDGQPGSPSYFYATTDEQVAFLDWKMKTEAIGVDGYVVGGDPTIYEVEPEDSLFRCPAPGCDYVTASEKNLKSHFHAKHEKGGQ